jgi:hypothetical protein
MKTIEIVVRRDGTVSIEALGYVGPACQEALAPFIEATGKGLRFNEPKREFFESAEQKAREEQ